ncbi:cation transporter [Massilia sp. WF1]|uniref:heavy metal translocating P-type ATPase n=1 Tax=unclassified Massilia TaxID=2609279 RepID=UPI00068CD488|nr:MULTISPECIES: heavy metal translocating P-type ATPase [unclassified Massilia]ALK97890.1 cation transporter [Massilia sp. WG5]KNZ67688.1 cation transporter [Massilia sp. WF1]
MNAVADFAACYHCGQPAVEGARWRALVNGEERILCCPGCMAAAEAIATAGLDGYYASRTGFAARIDEAGDDPALLLYDEAGLDGDAVFTVEGLRCAACVWLIERRVAALPGVRSAVLNVATERLQVRWDVNACRPSDILKALRAIGYTAYPYDATRHAAQLERARKALLRRLFVAGLSMMQVMMYAFPVYMATDGTMDADMKALMGWASFFLTLPAVSYCAWPFLRGAWQDLRRGLPGMDVPVALGILAAFAGSALSLVRGQGEVWFDSITMFVFLLLGSRWLELDARRKAARAMERLRRAAPATALRLPDWPATRDLETVAATALRPGDVILVPPGQTVAADGAIVEGDTEVDLALLTGESRTRAMGPGDALPGGAVNVTQAVTVRIGSSAADSTLAMLVRLSERAGQDKPALALWADRVGAWFVLALLALTVAVFAFWQAVDPARAWPAAIAVLVVSCPCALSLATPTALAAATERLLRHGVLAVKPHVLETLARATHVVFDKTGTLSRGRPVLRATIPLCAADGVDCLRIAAALEANSAHPLAQALREALAATGAPAPAAYRIENLVGQGVEGEVGGRRYRLGSAAFVAGLAGGAAAPAAPPGKGATAVWLGSRGRWLARFDLADALRPEASALVRTLQQMGKTVLLLSGDDEEAVRAVAAELGIRDARGRQLPQDKLDAVRALQAGGAVVAMVGDGINDAAVLGGADVSFAMGHGAQLAQLHADCVLAGCGEGMEQGSLAPLGEALRTANACMRIIRQNLGWAMLYNLVAIPLAVGGLLNPWLSGLGMAGSSALVVLNALRLRREG